MKKKCFLISMFLFLTVFVFGGCENNIETEITTEMITELATVVTMEETTEKKEAIATTEETTEKKTNEAQTEKSVVGDTEYVAPVTTTEKQESTTKKQEITTKKPVETQIIRDTTTKAPETTKKPTTTKAEYYPALTAADMEELKRYAIGYIESKGYRADPDIKWDNAGYYVTVGMRDDLSCYGDEFKIVGGAGYTPLEYAKSDLKGYIDYFIESCETDYGPGYIDCMYPLVRGDADGWEWTIGFWLAGQ